MRNLGANLDVMESRLIDLLNETFGNPEATASCMADLRALREQIHGSAYIDDSDELGRTQKARPPRP
jgi:hypothetical protein